MPLAPLVAHGGRILFVTSAYEAGIITWRLGPLLRAALKASHHGTTQPSAGQVGNAVFAPGKLIGGADIILSIYFEPNNMPPIHASVEPVQVIFPRRPYDALPIVWEFEGFATRLTIVSQLDTVVRAELTVRVGVGTMGRLGTGYTEGFEWAGPGPTSPAYTEGFEWAGAGALAPGYTEGFES